MQGAQIYGMACSALSHIFSVKHSRISPSTLQSPLTSLSSPFQQAVVPVRCLRAVNSVSRAHSSTRSPSRRTIYLGCPLKTIRRQMKQGRTWIAVNWTAWPARFMPLVI
eukprot:5599132-Prymnesium_polylepis.3